MIEVNKPVPVKVWQVWCALTVATVGASREAHGDVLVGEYALYSEACARAEDVLLEGFKLVVPERTTFVPARTIASVAVVQGTK